MSYDKRHIVNGWKLGWEDHHQVGRDPEYVDMSNPQGYIYRTQWRCTAIRDRYIYLHFKTFDSDRDIINLWQRIEETADKDWSPDKSEHWELVFDPTVENTGYGSEYHRLNYDEYEMGLMDDEERYHRYGF